MKKLLLAFTLLLTFAVCGYCYPDTYMGINIYGSEDQCSGMAKLSREERPNPNMTYYRSGNQKFGDKDIGSVYFGFNAKTGKFYSADFTGQFFRHAKRSFSVKQKNGAYQFMGKTELADGYLQLFLEEFTKTYGDPKIETRENTVNTTTSVTTSYNWDLKKEALFVSINSSNINNGESIYISVFLMNLANYPGQIQN